MPTQKFYAVFMAFYVALQFLWKFDFMLAGSPVIGSNLLETSFSKVSFKILHISSSPHIAKNPDGFFVAGVI